ncbi:MAG: hypothetical protein DRP45_08290 [Candidatus Zixiibacteriota bacterium]|nr:MAG: hypothetical protein DRP45_08290 [candidate division Zixibacteria bacterium]
MLYFVVIFVVVMVAVLLLRLRVRLEIADDKRLLFAGLGRTGPELDLRSKRGVFKLFGMRLREFETTRKKPEKTAAKHKRLEKAIELAERAEGKGKRRRSLRQIIQIVPQVTTALWQYLVGLLKSVIVEQAEGQIEAGFESPDITGRAFGYYQAALAAVPAMLGRVRYVPDWDGPSFSGVMHIQVALPLWRLFFQTAALLWRLPLIRIIKLAIGEKKGAQDG